MSKKTYKTFSLRGLVIRARNRYGAPVTIRFNGGIQVDSTATYVTSNAEIQRLLEKNGDFGRLYYLAEERPVEEDSAKNAVVESAPVAAVAEAQKDAAIVEYKDTKRFKNLVEMKGALRELGVEVADDANYLATKKLAAEAGYDFQIQK